MEVKKGIAPHNWQKVLEALEEALPPEWYWIVAAILERHATRYF